MYWLIKYVYTNSDGQRFHQYQQNETLKYTAHVKPFNTNHTKWHKKQQIIELIDSSKEYHRNTD